MLLTLVPVGVVCVVNAVWAVMRAFMAGPAAEAVRLVAGRIAESMHRVQAIELALEGLRPLLPWPYPRRLQKAADALRANRPITTVEALEIGRLLPATMVPLAKSAERLGPTVLEHWFRSVSVPPRVRVSIGRRIAPVLLTIAAIVLVMMFFSVFIAPKFELMAREIDLDFTGVGAWAWLQILAGPWAGLTLIIIVIVLVSLWSRWRWVMGRRILRGEIILSAVRSGVPEDAIAAALGVPRANASLTSICHAAGWKVADADALAIALASSRERSDRHGVVLMAVFEIVAPLLLAIPVLLLGRAVFGLLISIINSLENLS
ncbi:MAG: hypothetical protein H0V44_15300 [Planctomycetes bacterium]|nr:hypothetical protein [Planctomycetota bacterium]